MKKTLLKRILSLVLVVSITIPLVTNHVSASTLFSNESNEGLNPAEAAQSGNYNNEAKREKIIEKTKNSTTYQRTDGSKEVVMYSSDVRYRDEQNKLIDYDPSLVEITDETKKDNNLEGYQYENKQGDTKQYIPTNLTEETPVLLQYEDYQVTLRPIFSNEKIEAVSLEETEDSDSKKEINKNEKIEQVLENVDQELLTEAGKLDGAVLSSEKTIDIYDKVKTRPTKTTYSTTDNAIAFEYISQETGIKENIILNKNPDTNVFLYELSIKNAYPRENGIDGGITFYDKVSNDIIGNIPAPFMNDASNNAYSENVSFSIGLKEGTDDTYILALTVDTDYLNSADRQYPITIDPSYVWTGGTDVADAYVLNGATYGDTNFYSSAVTTFSVGDGSQGLYRTYIRFADFLHKLSGYYVDSAKLTIYETGSSQGNNTIQVHRVTEDWSKTTVTWNNRPGYSTTPINSVVTSGTSGKAKILDITSYARQVANGTYSSYGIMLRANDESSSGLYSQFYSSRSSSEALRPKLSVIYYDGPTTASSVTLKSAYLKPGATTTINWSGINSQSLNMIQYHIYKYDDETATLGDEIIGYSSSTKIGTTSSGSSIIPATASLSEGCYRIYVRGVDNGGIKGAGKGVTLHIDGTDPTLSTAEISPKTSVISYSNQMPILKWSGGDDHFSQVEYSINGLKKTSTSGTINLPASSFTTAGVYKIEVWAVDKADNHSAVKKLNYYYDPNVSNSNVPEITKVQFANTTNVSPDITITNSHPDGTSVAVSKVYYYMVASTSTTEPTDDQYILATNISNSGDITNLKLNSTETSKGNGVYKLYFKIQDVNNNTSEPFLAAYYRMVNVVYDDSVTLSATYNEADNVIALSWNGDSNISSVKLYKRYGEDSFKYGQTINTGTSVNTSTENVEDTADFRLLITYLDGSQKASNIVSILKESQIDESSGSEVLKYTVTTLDSDVDNIEDGYEIWQYNTDYLDDDTDDDDLIDGYELINFDTNPLVKDNDIDGFNDGYEVFILGTDPTVKTEDTDSDDDGIYNLIEYNNGTNPYLKDSDFDGFEDIDDTEPLITSSTSTISPNYDIEVNVGLYDRVEENNTTETGVTRKTIYNFSNQIKEVCDYTPEKILRKTYYFYDNNGNNTVTLSYADGKYILNTYSYKQDHLSSIYHNGFHYNVHYNENNDVSSISIGNQNLISYQYSDNGDQIGIQYANDQTKNMVYTENGYLESIKNNGNLDFVLEHDESGNILSLIDNVNDVKYTYTYDINSNLIGVSGNNGFSIIYENNSSIAQNSFNSTTSSTYSDNGAIRTQQGSQSTKIINEETNEFIYSTNVELISGDILSSNVNTKGNSSTSTLTIKQDDESVILSKTINKNETSSEVIYKDGNILTYGYDRNGNIVTVSKNESEIASYTYDGFNQLIRENDKTSEKTVVYTYDNGGNILKRTEYPYTLGELGTALSSTSYEYNNNAWKDMLTSFDNQSITYDNMGNPINYRDGINLSWANGRMLDTLESNVYTINYKYNIDGLRTEKVVINRIDGSYDKTLYYYDNGKLIEEKSNANTIWYIYDADDTLVGFELNGNAYYYETNLLKDITKIYDSNGVELVSYTYEAFGNITKTTGNQELAKINPFRYRSYYYDNDSGFYYLCTRYYDPITLRFLNADDTSYLGMTGTVLSNNLFAYCENDPVNGYDPYGVWKVSLADMGYFLIYVIGFNPIGTTLIGITVYKLSRLIAVKMALLGVKLGGVYPPLKIALGILGGVLGLQIGSNLAGAIWDCINLRKKYIDFSIKYNSWGIPYKLSIEAK